MGADGAGWSWGVIDIRFMEISFITISRFAGKTSHFLPNISFLHGKGKQGQFPFQKSVFPARNFNRNYFPLPKRAFLTKFPRGTGTFVAGNKVLLISCTSKMENTTSWWDFCCFHFNLPIPPATVCIFGVSI